MQTQLSTRAAKEAGFTLIELIIVIVIIGILAAVAIPKYVDLESSANTSALAGVSGNFASAYAVNKAMCSAYPTDTSKCLVSSPGCTTGTLTGLLPGVSGYTVAGTAPTCTITQTSTSSTQVVTVAS